MKQQLISRRTVLTACAGMTTLVASSPVAFSQTSQSEILRDGKITIGIHNQAPWGFKTMDGNVAGVHPDMIKAVLGPLGIKKVNFVIVEWPALIPSLMSKRIDAVASGMAITPVRCDQVIFSDPDLAIGDGAIVRAGNPHKIRSFEDIVKNERLRIGAGRGSTNAEHAMQAGIPKDRVLLFEDMQSSIAALAAGRIDADIESTATVISTVNDPNLKGKIERAIPFTGLIKDGREVRNFAGIAFRAEDSQLRDLYNLGLAKAKLDGTVKAIFARYGFTDAEIAPADATAKNLCPDNYR